MYFLFILFLYRKNDFYIYKRADIRSLVKIKKSLKLFGNFLNYYFSELLYIYFYISPALNPLYKSYILIGILTMKNMSNLSDSKYILFFAYWEKLIFIFYLWTLINEKWIIKKWKWEKIFLSSIPGYGVELSKFNSRTG